MKRDINRVVFYSKQDLLGDRNLQNAELIIENPYVRLKACREFPHTNRKKFSKFQMQH